MTAHIASIISNAVTQGFTARTILQYLSRNFPQYAGAIANASTMGYTADKILKHLVDPRGKNPENSDSYLTDSEKTDKSDRERKRKAALGLGAVVLGTAGGLAGLASRGSSVIPQILPNNPSPAPVQPTPMPQPQPLNPGPGLGQQIQQQTQAPIHDAMQPAQPGQIAQAAQALPNQMQQPQQPTTPQKQPPIFEQLLGGVDVNTLDDEKKQQLKFLAMISDKLQSEGKDLNDPAFKNLSLKIKDVLKGKPGTVLREKARFEAGKLSEDQSKAVLHTEKQLDPDIQYPKEFFLGKKKEDVADFANNLLDKAFNEVEQGIAQGKDYGVFHGDEWQAVGQTDVNEGTPFVKKKIEGQPSEKLIQVIEKHIPIRGLYNYHYNTAEKRKRMPFDKFSRGYEKTLEEMIFKKQNPEKYQEQEKKEQNFLFSLAKNEMPKDVGMFDEMQNHIEEMLFKQYDEEFEDYLTKMVKKIR